MPKQSVLITLNKLQQPVFSTRQLADLSGNSISSTVQSLNLLEKKGLIFKVIRGVWALEGNKKLDPYQAIAVLFPKNRVYVSFINALHLYGIIEQIPQVINLAALTHTRTINTKLGIYVMHQVVPQLFCGFDWYQEEGKFLIAQPEKALVDSLYLSVRKKQQFSYFPELHFPKEFSFKKTRQWAKKIPDMRISSCIMEKIDKIQRI